MVWYEELNRVLQVKPRLTRAAPTLGLSGRALGLNLVRQRNYATIDDVMSEKIYLRYPKLTFINIDDEIVIRKSSEKLTEMCFVGYDVLADDERIIYVCKPKR